MGLFLHFITELKIYHLYSFVTLTMTSTVLILEVCRMPVTYELRERPGSPWVLVAEWIEHPPCVWEDMGSIPVGNSDFSLFHACLMLISSLLTWSLIVHYESDLWNLYHLFHSFSPVFFSFVSYFCISYCVHPDLLERTHKRRNRFNEHLYSGSMYSRSMLL